MSIARLKSLNGLKSNLIFPNQVLKVSGSSKVQQTVLQTQVVVHIQCNQEIRYLSLHRNITQHIKNYAIKWFK